MPLAHGPDTAHPVQWLVPVLLSGIPVLLYLAGARRLQRGNRRWSRWRTWTFLAGTALLGVAVSPALEAASTDLRGHMAQHLLLGMYAPVALVLGAPVTLLLATVPMPARRPLARVLRSPVLHALSHPLTAAVLVVGGLYALYLTPLHALSTRSEQVHHLVHLHVVLAGCLFAWAVAGPDPAPRRPGTGVRIAVLVVAGGAHSLLAKLLHARAPAWPPGTSYGTVEVEQAAQWMYYGGHLSDLALLVALYAAWYRRAGRGLTRRRGQVRSAQVRERTSATSYSATEAERIAAP